MGVIAVSFWRVYWSESGLVIRVWKCISCPYVIVVILRTGMALESYQHCS